ncbi:MAG TPA: hypothetical protein VFZ25_14165 [Chloroflexota bacterium]|nr:hypothetical protein [Chloroflexota bacterium]
MTGITNVAIDGDDFLINGQPTYPGRTWRGHRIEGLLFNSRMVQATFDDLNPDTRERWAYPDTGVWDPERNVDEFLDALPTYRRHGLLAVTLNLQGGCPESYRRIQPWINTAFDAHGRLRPAYLDRLQRVLDRLDDLGMVAILGLFYFAQDERLLDEAAVRNGVDAAAGWLLDQGYTNVIVEIANECDVPRFEHEILQPARIHELIAQVRDTTRNGRRLLVGTSYRGRSIPSEKVLEVSDLALLHGNGVTEPAFIADMVARTRALCGSRPLPIVFNEDDHYGFDEPSNNLAVATAAHASWGYFDAGPGAGGHTVRSDYVEGYQNVPVNWRINTDRKRAFFEQVKEMTGGGN